VFDPFSRTRTPGFNVRPQDDVPGFRLDPEVLDPEAEVPGFNIDENGLPRPRSLLGSGSSVQPTPPQVTADTVVLSWLRGSLALPQPWTPPGLRWPPAGGLAVGPTETTATMREPDDPDAVQESDPDATNSIAAAPRYDDELYSQAGVSDPWAPSIVVPPLPAVPPSADPNFVLANADDDVQEAQRQTLPPQTRQKPQARPPAPSGPGQGKTPPPTRTPALPGMEPTEAERRREQEFADLNAKWRRLQEAKRRQSTWETVIRTSPPPDDPNHKVPNLLPDNWQAFLEGIDPRYAAWTRAAAERNNIPPELLARLLYQESKYDKNSVSPNRTAFGIAQLTPGAVKSVGRDPRTFNYYYDPQAAIDAGAAYLALQYRRFSNWPKAVAAYNAGGGRVEGWLQGYRDDPSALLEKDWPHWWQEINAHLRSVFQGRPDYFDR
jgi:soluble lytic murein transglycosylase-like protein